MDQPVVLTDVFLDNEPVGLAETWAAVEPVLPCIVESEESLDEDSVVYFALPAAEEIVEVKGRIAACSSVGDSWHLTVEIIEADASLVSLLSTAFKPETESGEKAGPLWGDSLKQTDGKYAVVINSPAGILTPSELTAIAGLATQTGGFVKLTHAQRMLLLVAPAELESTKEALSAAGLKIGVLHHGIRNVRACCGALCRFSQEVNAINLAQRIDEEMFGFPTHYDVKIAVADCKRNCSEAYCADIGLIGTQGHYDLLVGGRGSQIPFRAVRLGVQLTPQETPGMVRQIVNWYQEHSNEGERLWRTLERLGREGEPPDTLPDAAGADAARGDGVDECSRLQAHLARVSGARILRAALDR